MDNRKVPSAVRMRRALAIGTGLVGAVSVMVTAIAAQGHSARAQSEVAAAVKSRTRTVQDSRMAETVAYPLQISRDRRYLRDRRGRPFFIVGDSPQAIIGNLLQWRCCHVHRKPKESRFQLAARGPALCVRYTGCRDDATTIDGIPPFTTPGDLSTPNPKYFAGPTRSFD